MSCMPPWFIFAIFCRVSIHIWFHFTGSRSSDCGFDLLRAMKLGNASLPECEPVLWYRRSKDHRMLSLLFASDPCTVLLCMNMTSPRFVGSGVA